MLAGGPPQLAPRDAQVERAWFLGPSQVLVEWRRVERVAPKGGKPYPNTVWRLVLWTQRGHWRAHYVIAGPTALSPIDDVRFADVTLDGRPDLLVSDVQGNHGSGPYRVVTVRRGRARTILAGSWSESFWRVSRGSLTINEPRGGQSVCCPDFRAFLTYRWNGRLLTLSHTRLVKQSN